MGSLTQKSKGLQGRRFTKEQKDKALGLLSSGMGPSDVAKIIVIARRPQTRRVGRSGLAALDERPNPGHGLHRTDHQHMGEFR